MPDRRSPLGQSDRERSCFACDGAGCNACEHTGRIPLVSGVERALSNLESAVKAARHYHDKCSVGPRPDYESMVECVADANYRAEVLHSELDEALR